MSKYDPHGASGMAADSLVGVQEIAAYIGKTERQTHHLLATKRLPAFLLGARWHMRRSTYRAYIEKLEADNGVAAGQQTWLGRSNEPG